MPKLNLELTEKEVKLAENLAKLLYSRGKIPEPTPENALRVALRFTSDSLVEVIRRQRYG